MTANISLPSLREKLDTDMKEENEDYSNMSLKELEKKRVELEKELKTEEMRCALYEKMIEIAEREYHIQILPPGFKK